MRTNSRNFVIKDGILIKCNADVVGEVIIPNCVTEIGTDAFIKHNGITSVTISDSVTTIGINAFRDCENLKSIYVSKSVTEIGDWSFCSCLDLLYLAAPDIIEKMEKKHSVDVIT